MTSENVKIFGVLATPRVSRNGYLYLPDELEAAVKKLGNKTIPIYLEHVDARNAVGTARLVWNDEKKQVEYEGEIFDPDIELKIKAGAIRHVSLGADYDVLDIYDGLEIPRGLEFRELSLVAVPGIPEANVEIAERKYTIVDGEIKLVEKVGGNLNFPIADRDRPWDADAAVGRIRKWASSDGSGDKDKIDWSKYSQAFFWFDENDKENFGAYKLPFVDIIDGRPSIIPRAVVAVAAALQGARGGVDIPEADAEKIKSKVAQLYRKIFDEPAPWEREEASSPAVDVEKMEEAVAGEDETEEAVAKNIIQDNNIAMSQEAEKAPTEPVIVEKAGSLAETEADRKRKIFESLREAITGASGAYGFTWSRDIIALPPALVAELRDYTDFKEIPRGGDRVKWYKLAALTFGALTEGTPPTEASQALTTVEAVPAEYGAKQVISYNALESATVDLVDAVETAMLNGALAREDDLIIGAIDSADVTNIVYGGGKTAEANLTSTDVLGLAEIVKAIQKIQEGKVAFRPGELVLVVHPKQYADLLQNASIQKAMEFGGPEAIREGRIPELLGCRVIVSTQVRTGSGSGSPPVTTFHAVLFKARAVGFATTRDLLIETFRAVDKRQLEITGSLRSAAKVLVPEACCKIYTA